MPECRKKLVRYVFQVLDKNGDKILTAQDIAQNGKSRTERTGIFCA